MGGLRGFLAQLENTGDVCRLAWPVSPKHEAAAVIAETDKKAGKVVYLENLKGYKSPVVANIFGRRDRIARILGSEMVIDFCLEKIKQPVKVELLKEGRCQENIHRKNVNILELMPVLTHFEKDAGPYLTTGMLIARLPGSNVWSMGIHRMQVKGNNRMGVLLFSPPLSNFLKQAESKGLPLEVAVAVGVDPILLLASVIWTPKGSNKAEVASALAGSPMQFVKGVTVDVHVPADAEYVLEGRILPGVREPEGPFGEETGVYTVSRSPVIEISAITSRQLPIYQALVPFTSEGRTLLSIASEIAYSKSVKDVFPQVRELRVSQLDWTMLVIQVSRSGRHLAKMVIDYLFGMSPYIKSVVVVDEDIDPADPAEVMWSVATRCQPSKDVVIKDGLVGSVIDPSIKEDGTSSKIGYDTTVPEGKEETYRKIKLIY